MSYQEYTPPIFLSPYIDTFWSSIHDSSTKSKILPDGCVDIIFKINNKTNHLPNSTIISGMMTKYRNVISKEHSETYGIRFKTGMFNCISNFPLSEIKNSTINASEVILNLPPCFLEQLTNKKNRIDKIQFLEIFLKNQLNNQNTIKNELILSVCSSIRSSFSDINISQIAQNHNISLRQLERRFKFSIGVTMKEYHRIIRLNKTLKHISEKPKESLLHTAFDYGYYDHAHLTKEILKMTGENPSSI